MTTYEPKYYKLTSEKDRWDGFPGREIINFIRDKSKLGSKILDVGCGTAGILEFLPEEIFYTGVDTSSYALDEAKKRWASRTNTIFLLYPSPGLPFEDARFDIILLFYSLEHLKSPKETLKECRRVLKRGGRIIVAAPNLEFPAAFPNALRHKPLIYHVWFLTLRIFDYAKRLVSSYSFRVLKENFTSRTGKYEKKDDDLWHMVSSWEVIKFLESHALRLEIFWRERKLSGWRKMLSYLPTLCWYGMPLAAVFVKDD